MRVTELLQQYIVVVVHQALLEICVDVSKYHDILSNMCQVELGHCFFSCLLFLQHYAARSIFLFFTAMYGIIVLMSEAVVLPGVIIVLPVAVMVVSDEHYCGA